jgi:hypothetical protein
MRLPNGPSIPTLYLCSLWPVLSGLGKAPSAPCSCCALVFDGAVGLFAVWADSGPCTFFSGVVRSTGVQVLHLINLGKGSIRNRTLSKMRSPWSAFTALLRAQ